MVKPYCQQFLDHRAMVKWYPLRHPMVKPYPPQGSYISKIGDGAEVRWWSSRGYGFTIECRRGTILPYLFGT